MSRKCIGIGSVYCKDNRYKSSAFCKFHLWVMDHYGTVNKIIKEYEGYQKFGSWRKVMMESPNVKI